MASLTCEKSELLLQYYLLPMVKLDQYIQYIITAKIHSNSVEMHYKLCYQIKNMYTTRFLSAGFTAFRPVVRPTSSRQYIHFCHNAGHRSLITYMLLG